MIISESVTTISVSSVKVKPIMSLAGTIRIVCIGDSLTAGSESADYPALLQQRLGSRAFVTNLGKNGATTGSVLRHLNIIARSEADVAVILLGTNDVLFMFDSRMKWVARFRGPSDPGTFAQNLRAIAQAFTNVGTRVLLVAPPPFGENPNHVLNHALAPYIEHVKHIATERGCKYIPLNEEIGRCLDEGKRKGSEVEPAATSLAYKALFKKRVLGRSWDQIADEAGLAFTIDGVHLNDRGARILVELVVSALEEVIAHEASQAGM
ncbi:MAG: SGNH/GDSL hydrolase family protein [Chloroflexales bacterium]|nr:SGNH/GDSL hydrolase family protein [Chloroflexales bacterium]